MEAREVGEAEERPTSGNPPDTPASESERRGIAGEKLRGEGGSTSRKVLPNSLANKRTNGLDRGHPGKRTPNRKRCLPKRDRRGPVRDETVESYRSRRNPNRIPKGSIPEPAPIPNRTNLRKHTIQLLSRVL